MKHEPTINSLLRQNEIVRAFRRWLCEHGDTLVDAAALLGGLPWSRRARAIVTCARTGGDLHSRRRDIGRLARLLRLDFVDDPSRPEAARFAALHPDDPSATDAMYCAEAVTRGARALEALWLAGRPGSGTEAE